MTQIVSSESAAADVATPAALTTSELQYVSLRDLAIAPENPRTRDPADPGIPRLAATIKAVGVLIPLLVRQGSKQTEKPAMAIDGRRRFLGLMALLKEGAVTEDYQVPVIFSADKGIQAAAGVVANEERIPIHVADVIVAIGKLRRRRYSVADIAAALAYDEADIKRLQALSELDRQALRALKENCINLGHARLLARISDKAVQRQLAEHALAYRSLPEHLVHQHLASNRVDVNDDRLSLVSLDAYHAAGGRLEGDLFGELPDVVRDPGVLQDAWLARIQPVVDGLKAAGLQVFHAQGRGYGSPEGFERIPYVYHPQLQPAARDALAAARSARDAAHHKVTRADLVQSGDLGVITDYLLALRDEAAAPFPRRQVGAVAIFPDDRTGLCAEFFLQEAVEDLEVDDEADETDGDEVGELADSFSHRNLVEVPKADVDVEGHSHALHEMQTDVGTRGLMRDLADNPAAALTAIVAHLFKHLVLRRDRGEESALRLQAEAYSRTGFQPIDALDGDVRRRLEAHKRAYAESGLRPIPWVETLAFGERMALLAELTALTLNLREIRTTNIRHGARAEAAELAELCGYDITQHWTPDAAYLVVHSKPQLFAMLEEMKVDDPRAAGLKKGELVTFTSEAAAERAFAPAVLGWPAASRSEAEPAPDAGEAGENPALERAAEPDSEEDVYTWREPDPVALAA